jgi:hypothetical protein
LEKPMSARTAASRWSEIVDEHEASGQSIRTFAELRGLKPETLSWWRWKLGRAVGVRKRGFVELTVEDAPSATEGELVLELAAYGVRTTVDASTDLELLRRVLGALC